MSGVEMKFKVEKLINNVVETKLGNKNLSYTKPPTSRHGEINQHSIVVGKHTTYNVVGERNFKHYLKVDKIMLFGEK